MFQSHFDEQIEQWYIDLMNANGDTIAEEYITCTYPEAKEQADIILSTLVDADHCAIRAASEI